jgi:hypothetical protein
LLKIRTKITGGCGIIILLEKLLRKTCFLMIFWLADCYYKLRIEISLKLINICFFLA